MHLNHFTIRAVFLTLRYMRYLVILFFFGLSLQLNAQAIYKCSEGEVSFFSETPMENIDAHNKSISSFINTATGDVVFVIPVRNFKFQKAMMEEHFNEKYLESDKYPDATFQGKLDQQIDAKQDGEYKVTATGKLKMHNVERVITVPGTITVKNGNLALKAEFNIALKDYDITVPKIVVTNIAEVIAVKVAASYIPYKK
jgi:hypothetical protein